jgi:hypothetical protein
VPNTPCVCCRRRAYAALLQFTRRTISELQADDDEILRGVDWSAVACTADMCNAVKKVLRSSNTITARHDGGGRSARQSSELHGSSLTKAQKSKAATAASLTARSSLLSDLQSSSEDARLRSNRSSQDWQQGLGIGSEGQNPGSPMILTRASLAAASSRSVRGLTVPLLGRQYSSRAAERYKSSAAAAAAGDDDASEGSAAGFEGAEDVESGLLPQQVSVHA